MSKKDQVLAALPHLTKAELQQISKVVSSLLPSDAPKSAVLWFDAFSSALGIKSGFSLFKKFSAGRQLSKHADSAEEFVQNVVPATLKDRRKIVLSSARDLLIELLIADLKRRKVTPSLGVLAVNLGRLSEVFDDAYPGYRKAGLTHLIFDRRDAQ